MVRRLVGGLIGGLIAALLLFIIILAYSAAHGGAATKPRSDAFPLHVGSCGKRVKDATWLLAGNNRWHIRTWRAKPVRCYTAKVGTATATMRWRIGYAPFAQDRSPRALAAYRSFDTTLRAYLTGRPLTPRMRLLLPKRWPPSSAAYPLKLGSHGVHVRDAQWALAHNRFGFSCFKGKPNGLFGKPTRHAVVLCKWRMGYPRKHLWPVYGKVMRAFLLRGPKLLEGEYRRNWIARRKHPSGPPKPREHFTNEVAAIKRAVAIARYDASREWLTHYTQGSSRWYGIANGVFPPRVPLYADCSSDFTYWYWAAGGRIGQLPDPNGNGWTSGFTGTLATHGRRVYTAEPGDAVLYGHGYPYGHVVMAIGHGLGVSHGSESGPRVVPINYRPIAQIRRYVRASDAELARGA